MALDATSLIDELARQQFEAAWRSGRRAPIEQFLPAPEDPRFLPTLEELVIIDLELCWKSSRDTDGKSATFVAPQLDDYLVRFPALNQTEIVARLLEEEESIRDRHQSDSGGAHRNGNPTPTALEIPGYRVQEMLGKGAMGIVYKAQQLGLNRVVALKMILPGTGADADDLLRFRSEAEAVARLQHPHIVQIFEVGEHAGQPFFSLEFVAGGSLDKKLRGEPQVPADAARLVRTLAHAIHAAHERGLVHRDLKPANVLLTHDGTPKITDFGLAKQLDADSGQTRSGAIMGTPCYMAPEQALGNLPAIRATADVYALGAILYEMLTGRPPFRGASVLETLEQVRTQEPVAVTQLQPKVSRDLETICLKCLNKEPGHRYGSAAALAEDLRRFLDGEPIVARPASWSERGVKWARRRPVAAALIAVSVLALLSTLAGLALAVSYYQDIRERERLDHQASNENRRNAQAMIDEGRTALNRGERVALVEARGKFKGALALVESRPELVDVRLSAAANLMTTEQRLADEKTRDIERAKLLELRRATAEARLHGMPVLPGGQLRDSLRIRAIAAHGLSLFAGSAADLRKPVLSAGHFNAEEQAEIVNCCYELVLHLADTIAQPLPGENAETQAKHALKIIDQTDRLQEKSLAWHLYRARYLKILHDDDGATRELELAKASKGRGSVLDEFLQGYECLHRNEPDPTLAIEHFRAALRLQPRDFWSRLLLGVSYINVRPPRPASAEEAFSDCIGEQNKFVWGYLLRGYARTELGRESLENPSVKADERRRQMETHFADADADFTAAENLAQVEPMAQFVLAVNRGNLRLLQNRRTEAMANFMHAAELQPKEAAPREMLARTYLADGKLAEALQHSDYLVKTWPERAAYYRSRARIHLAGNDLAAAENDLNEAINKEPTSGSVSAEDYKELGVVYARQRRFAEAVAAYDRAVELQKFFPIAHRLRAEALIELQRYPEALSAFNRYFDGVGGAIDFYRLVRKEPVADAYRNRGLVKARVLHPAKALEDYGIALELEQDAATYAARGWIYIVTDSPRLALPDFEEAIRLEPMNGDAYAGRGHARVMLNQHQFAVLDAEKALTHGPRTPRLVYNVARIFAVAVAKAELEQQLSGKSTRPLQEQLQDRALALIGDALRLLPVAERRQFWSDYISSDRALERVRPTNGFKQLALEMTR